MGLVFFSLSPKKYTPQWEPPEWILFILLKSSSATEEKKNPNPLHNLHSNDFQPTFTFQIKLADLSHGFGI